MMYSLPYHILQSDFEFVKFESATTAVSLNLYVVYQSKTFLICTLKFIWHHSMFLRN